MSDIWCRTCGHFDYGHHRCPPAYLWWCLDDGERASDARTVHANDPEEAAQAAAEADHSGGAYEADWPRRYAVQAKRGGDRKVRIFDVEREIVPEFRAGKPGRCILCQRLSGPGWFRCKRCARLRRLATESPGNDDASALPPDDGGRKGAA